MDFFSSSSLWMSAAFFIFSSYQSAAVDRVGFFCMREKALPVLLGWVRSNAPSGAWHDIPQINSEQYAAGEATGASEKSWMAVKMNKMVMLPCHTLGFNFIPLSTQIFMHGHNVTLSLFDISRSPHHFIHLSVGVWGLLYWQRNKHSTVGCEHSTCLYWK